MSCCQDKDKCGTEQGSIEIRGIPDDVSRGVADLCRARLTEAVRELIDLSGVDHIQLTVGNGVPSRDSGGRTEEGRGEELSIEERARQYESRKPFYDFDFLVIPPDLRQSLLSAVDLVRLEEMVFGVWNLKSIEPFPRTALNFHGPPGTGKTLAAHALAHYLGRPILLASYGQIESKFVGDGAKNVEAVFFAAQRDEAVLFVDEADSLLSKRLTSVTQGAEQAINSMRSQLLVCLEQFRGVVIFATNLVENYDRGFETRVRNLYFPMPDAPARHEIWRRHLPPELPLHGDVSLAALAEMDGLCGRDIKNAVIDAALRAARDGRSSITQEELIRAVKRVQASRVATSVPDSG